MTKITEARLNDFTYIALKRYFFESWGMNPRECDIRICMDMVAPERITSIANAILHPNEVAGKSHTTTYEVDTNTILEVVIDYMEDHWIKQELPAEYKAGMREEWPKDIVPKILEMPEDQCGG